MPRNLKRGDVGVLTFSRTHLVQGIHEDAQHYTTKALAFPTLSDGRHRKANVVRVVVSFSGAIPCHE